MLTEKDKLNEIAAIIAELREKTERLKKLSGGMHCIDRNCERILAGVLMLELNFTDAYEFLD